MTAIMKEKQWKNAVSFCASWVVFLVFFFFDSFQFCCLCIIVEQKSVSLPIIHSNHNKSQALLLNICVSVFISSKKEKKKNQTNTWAAFRSESHCASNSESPWQCSAFKVIFNFYICIYIYMQRGFHPLYAYPQPKSGTVRANNVKCVCFVFHLL